MAGRVIIDYSHVGYSQGSKQRWRWRPALLAAGVVLLLAVALYGGRAAWRTIQARGSNSSHALSSGQLGALKPVQNPAVAPRPSPSASASPSPVPPPARAVLSIPYTVQAPLQNWKVFENACEEAAVLMYHDYLEGDQRAQLPPAEVDPALRAMEKWQVDNWGAERDLTLDRTGQFAQAYYGYHYAVLPATVETITAQVAAGHPVIVPVMTKSLQNNHYGRGNVYHEVLIKGYTPDGVVTNDAGVQEGKDWFYSWNIIFGAIDAQAQKMGQGRVALVLTK
jgi:hypothetical protein